MSRLSQSELLDGSQLLQARVDTWEGVETFRSALFQGNTTLEGYHLAGGDPEIVGRRRSWLIDRILLYAWPQFIQRSFQSEPPLLIAAGGYGRAELNIASDIDLLILLPDRSPEQLKTTERFIQFCWDAGLKVGHSARTIQDCVTLSLQNLSVATSLMEIRLLHGSQ